MKLLIVDYFKDKIKKTVNFKKHRIISYINMEDDNNSESCE